MSSHLSQLIGRSNHREHKNNSIHIHTYACLTSVRHEFMPNAVDPNLVYYIKDNFFIGTKIVEHNKPQQIKGKHRLSTILLSIENILKNSNKDIIYLRNILQQYTIKEDKLRHFCNNHKNKLITLGNNYNYKYEKPRGKYPQYIQNII